MLVANFTTKRIFINNGNSADILFWDAFTQMEIGPARKLKGFSGDMVQPVGTITLSILAGKAPHTALTIANFIVMKAPSSYNTILGWLTLNNLKVVTSTYHLIVKFPTAVRVGEIRGEQVLAHESAGVEIGEGGGSHDGSYGPRQRPTTYSPSLPLEKNRSGMSRPLDKWRQTNRWS
ncbi:uncharacterized protein LOC121236622 [Juglans microcarpa x Juglans regia]|uniref:uncharacterized protein LOC121236622 n=1 Tax=Juglans microcarpa x Juglans regia TaxID=2249226 RepID=UPI001B7E899C|nr:uncharacterized protein LOC121236622 [Juglans microcarpa x Juglans regia]